MKATDDDLRYAPSFTVRTITTQYGDALLDYESGICINLTVVASEIWQLLNLNWQFAEIVDWLATEFNAPREQIHSDATDFISVLRWQGLLVSEQLRGNENQTSNIFVTWVLKIHYYATRKSARTRKRPRFLFLQALAGLCLFDVLRFSKSLRTMARFVQHWEISRRIAPEDTVSAVSQALDYACLWYPKRARCLQRSVVRTCLLRNYGLPAQMVLGAQPLPFKAHAWTEVLGAPIHERRDVQKAYLTWDKW